MTRTRVSVTAQKRTGRMQSDCPSSRIFAKERYEPEDKKGGNRMDSRPFLPNVFRYLFASSWSTQ